MKVLDLQCAHGHVFEGWFGSQEDYASQRDRGLLSCPICGDTRVEKKLSAPRLNLKSSARSTAPESALGESDPQQPEVPVSIADLTPAQIQAAYTHVVREMLRQTEDVGERFAEEARAIHAGDAQERGIRGQATPEQAQQLAEEGIAVMALPVPDFAKYTLQ
jgi:hypothetical protein